jgi:hypothetical protein
MICVAAAPIVTAATHAIAAVQLFRSGAARRIITNKLTPQTMAIPRISIAHAECNTRPTRVDDSASTSQSPTHPANARIGTARTSGDRSAPGTLATSAAPAEEIVATRSNTSEPANGPRPSAADRLIRGPITNTASAATASDTAVHRARRTEGGVSGVTGVAD